MDAFVLVFLCGCLVILGSALSAAGFGEYMDYHMDLALDIVICFISWGLLFGTVSYTITTVYNGKERTIQIG